MSKEIGMPRLVLKVIVPAREINATYGPLPDPTDVYAGNVVMAGINVAPPMIGDAVVLGGIKSRGQWSTCQYTRDPFLIPGVGQIQEV
jgi:hypothetical protein